MPTAPRTRVGDPVVRQRVMSLVVLLVLAIFAARLVMIQGVNAEQLSKAALDAAARD